MGQVVIEEGVIEEVVVAKSTLAEVV